MPVILKKYLVSTVGLLLAALGIALSIISNLGTAPLSCPSYILSLKWEPTVGEFTIIINTLLIAVQLLVLRKRFKLKYMMQIPASILFGYMIDFWMMVLGSFSPSTLFVKWMLILAGSAVTSLGISLEVASQAWMLSAEMTVYAFTKVCSVPFRILKIIMDCLFVVIAAVISFLLFGNPAGAGEFTSITDILLARMPGIMIGAGTVVLAVLPGYFMKWTDPPVARMLAGIRLTEEDTKWEERRKK